MSALSTLFNIQKLLGIAPFSVKNRKNNKQIIYSVIIISFYSFALFYTLYTKSNFFLQINTIKLAIRIIIDISLLSINYFSFFVVIYKKREWLQIYNNLKNLEALKENKFSYCFSFFLSHFLYLTILICSFLLRIIILSDYSFYLFTLQLIQHYMKFLTNLQIYITLKMLLSRYKLIKNRLMEHQDQKILRQCKSNLYRLKETINFFIEIFGWPFLFLIIYATSRVLYTLERVLRISDDKIQFLITDVILIICYLV